MTPQDPENEATVSHKFENFQKIEILTDKLKKYSPRTKISREKRWCTIIFDLTPQGHQNETPVPQKFENFEKIEFLKKQF